MLAKACRCVTFLALSLFLAAGIARAQEDKNVSDGGRTLFGRVVDAQGRPLAGVEIWRPFTFDERKGRTERIPAAVTAADGVFMILNAAPIERLTVCPAEWLYGQVTVAPIPTAPPVEIRLQPAARMAGRVVDGRGEPVPGIDVTAWFAGWSPGDVIDGPPPPCPGNSRTRYGPTDADGRFVYEGMEPGWFQVTVSGASQPQIVRWQAVAGEGGRELEIVLPRELVPLEGQVVDAEGKPVEGAQVMVSGVQPPAPAQTDATGAFRFSRATGGLQHLTVSHPDLGWIEKEIQIERSPARLDVRMPRASLVQGKLADRDGSPVADATMSVDFHGVEVDSEGRFRFSVPAGEHEVMADARDWVPLKKTITATGGPIELNLELSRPATVFGRVTGLLPGERGLVKLEEEGDMGTLPNDDGSFQINMVAPGTWTLAASDANGRTVKRRVQVEEGREVTVGDLPFPPLPEVRGRVLDPEGVAVRYVRLSFLQGERKVYASTDMKGRFKVHLLDGTWTVKAEMPGLGPATTTVTMAGAPAEIPDLRLVPTAMVSGYVRGLAPGEVPLMVATSEDGLWTLESSAGQDLRFYIPNLWPGTWTLTAWVGERHVSTQVRILPGDKVARADVSFGED